MGPDAMILVFWILSFKPAFHSPVSVQFSSVTQSCPTLCDPMDCSTPSLPVHHQLLEFTQTHAHWVGDAIQPSHPLSSPSPFTFNLFQHQGIFKWVSSLTLIKRLFSSSSLSAIKVYHLHIRGYWYFFRQSWFQLVIHPAQDVTWCTLHIS